MIEPSTDPTVIARIEGRAGRITLNRAAALNALDLEMTDAIIAALLTWREDPGVEAVMIDHAGARGFAPAATSVGWPGRTRRRCGPSSSANTA